MAPRDLLADLAPFKGERIAPLHGELVALAQKFARARQCGSGCGVRLLVGTRSG